MTLDMPGRAGDAALKSGHTYIRSNDRSLSLECQREIAEGSRRGPDRFRVPDNASGLPARPKKLSRTTTPASSRSGYCSNTRGRSGP